MEQQKCSERLSQTVEGNLRRWKQCFTLPLKIVGASENEGKQEIVFFLTIESFCVLYGFSGIGDFEGFLPKFEKYFMTCGNET